MELIEIGHLKALSYNLIDKTCKEFKIRWPELIEIQRNGNFYSILAIEELQKGLKSLCDELNLYPTAEIAKTTNSQMQYINSLIAEFVQVRYGGVICYFPSTLSLYFFKG